MKRILLYPLSVLFYICFGVTLLFCHALQWLCLKLGGYRAHKVSVDFLNLALMRCLWVMGSRCSYENNQNLPDDKPLLVVSNHQSMFDIIAISWFMRAYHPKFISKIELGKNIPSVSFNLRHGGSVLIDRKNPRQSIPALTKFSKYIATERYAAVIFPEGTRSKTGKPKEFSTTGLKILLKNMPEAFVVPVTVNNSWKIVRYGSFPINGGINLTLKVQEPFSIEGHTADEAIAKMDASIKKDIHY